MKNYSSQYKSKYNKLFQWGKLLSITGSSQVLVQATGLISGIFIIRVLPTSEYALYTIANTMLGTMTLLADSGISTGTLSNGSKVWNDRNKLGVVISTGLKLRNQFAFASVILVFPILFYLLTHNGAPWLKAVIIVVAIFPSFFAGLSDSLLEVPLKLKEDIVSLQKNQLAFNVAKMITILLTGLFPWAGVALLANGVPRYWANIRLRKISNKHADASQKADPVIEKDMFRIVKRSLPEILYYCFSGQITIWLISIFGSVSSIAKMGAISRITVLLNLFGAMFATLIVPRFAKQTAQKIILINFFKIIAGSIILILIVLGATWLLSGQFLWLLGNKYANLNVELVLCILNSLLAMLSGFIFNLYSSKGWIINPVVSIGLNVLFLICGIFLFKFDTLKSVILFNIFVSSLQAVMHFIYCFYKINRMDKQIIVS